jgi:ATP/ADP translocase
MYYHCLLFATVDASFALIYWNGMWMNRMTQQMTDIKEQLAQHKEQDRKRELTLRYSVRLLITTYHLGVILPCAIDNNGVMK